MNYFGILQEYHVKNILKISAIIGAVECLIMLSFSFLPSMPYWLEVTLDVGLISIICSIFVYRFSVHAGLLNSTRMADTLIKVMAEGLIVYDKDLQIKTINQSALSILRLSQGGVDQKLFTDPRWNAIHEDSTPFKSEEDPCALVLQTGRSQKSVVIGIQTQDWQRRWLQINALPYFLGEDSSRPDQVIVTFSDITEQKNNILEVKRLHQEAQQSARDLAESEERLKFALEATGDGVWDWDIITGHVTHNSQWCNIVGLEKGFMRHPLEEFIKRVYSEDLSIVSERIQNCLHGRSEYVSEHRMVKISGEIIWVQDRGQVVTRDADGAPLRMVGSITDITKKVQARKKTEELTNRLEKAVEAVKFGVWDWYVQKGNLIWDPFMYRLFDINKDDFTGDYDAFQKTLLPEDAPRVLKELDVVFAKQGKEFRSEFRILTKDNSIRNISAVASCFYDSEGKIERLVGFNWDITERVESQKLIEKQQEKLRSIFEGNRDAIVLMDEEGVFECNVSALEMFEIQTKEEFYKCHISDISVPVQENGADSKKASEGYIYKAYSDGTQRFEWMCQSRRGKIFPVEFILSSFIYDGKKVIQAIARDITDRKAAEKNIELQREKLVSSSKMASLGEMAGGIAHEINNPLAIIAGKAEQIRKKIEANRIDNERFIEDLKKIENTSNRIAKIIRGLRSFSRNSDSDPMQRTNIATIVTDTIELCQERFKQHDINLEVDCQSKEAVECRASQISQVLMNLLNNAFDAIESYSEKWVSLKVLVEEGKVQFAVTDSGNGIPESVVQKMMQPFFTTKEVGKGTGLGLSISMGIASEHNGVFRYDNTCKNTRFILEIPLLQPKKETSEEDIAHAA